MQKRERIFYLDFIRVVAVISILLTHYNALYIYMWNEAALKKVVLTWKVANIYIGDFGVSLFLIISGAALMYVYEEKLELRAFYKKRFLSIYPMYWLAWFCAFLYSFYLNRGIDRTIPKKNIIFTLLGMDGYLSSVCPTFYEVGDWFVGFIVIMYILFPILWYGIKKNLKLTAILIGVLYLLNLIWNPWKIPNSTVIFMRLPEIFFGMYFIKYIKKVKFPVAIVSILVLFANSIIQPQVDKNIQTTYVGITSFLLLVYVADKISACIAIKKFCKIISKYSYAIFLTHHYIIYQIAAKFDLNTITILESYILFCLCCMGIAFFSKLLYEGNAHIVKYMGERRHAEIKGKV